MQEALSVLNLRVWTGKRALGSKNDCDREVGRSGLGLGRGRAGRDWAGRAGRGEDSSCTDLQVAPHTMQSCEAVVDADLFLAAVTSSRITASSNPHM